MRVFWEQTGILLPVYRLAGAGLDDRDIAIKLNVTEERVQTCMTWLLHFLELATRNQLVQYASGGSLSL
jgi:DNA-binding CsgD family transcriptional regulator